MIDMLLEMVDSSDELSRLSERVQPAVLDAFKNAGAVGGDVKNALHGTWLGHPLHPVLVSLPIGAWTAAVLFDVGSGIFGRKELRAGADACVAFGLVGALGSAATGLADWTGVTGKGRQLGSAHAILNLSATALFATSLGLRRARHRKTGIATALMGYGLALVSSYIGGDLVYGKKVGVDHAERDGLPDDYVAVLAEGELEEGRPRRVDAKGAPVVLVRQGDTIRALYEKCSHMGGPLAEGSVEGDNIRCPWHGSCFSLDDGHVVDGPATFPQPCFDARINKGQIEVRRV
ncbi:MAG: Rieske 2Fe-2S domain-containing protein [Candidatus Eremiobacteraeota bacterium]|nr:Rieske 2Fe-2S domain-containing protein [Candidatus Eremiobacteraeota bacterium]MBC5828489.1 Rieske 2Fe-2S domain-containing protein [Candidatus Eremiobacteraeota bacterium]